MSLDASKGVANLVPSKRHCVIREGRSPGSVWAGGSLRRFPSAL